MFRTTATICDQSLYTQIIKKKNFCIFFCIRKEKCQAYQQSLSTKETKAKFNNGENFNKKAIDLSIKNKKIAFCSDLSFGMLPFSSYADIESMNIISSDVDMNEYKLSGTKSKRIGNTLTVSKLKMPLF